MSTPDSNTETGLSEPPIVIAGPAMDPAVKTIQPGGGVVMSIELLWGRVRRRLLRTLRPGFVRRIAQTRQGEQGPVPFEAVDPRDLKYYRNQPTYWWAEEDDPYGWRDSLPFVRAGLAELILLGGGSILLGIALSLWWWPLGLPMGVIAVLIVWFFRNPHREITTDHGAVVSPADGKLVQIQKVDDPELGPCVQFGIFLSIFNVHVNRASLPGRVIAVRYRPGKFLNALRPESAQENENFDVFLVDNESPNVGSEPRTYRIRQITGQFARRIVCWVRPGDVLGRGEIFGMIKLGSRTELLIPDSPQLDLVAELNQKVCAGSTTLARYRHPLTDAPSTTETVEADEAKDSP